MGIALEEIPVKLKSNQTVWWRPGRQRLLYLGGGQPVFRELSAVLALAPHARVKVIALEIDPEIHRLATVFQNLEILEKELQQEDLEGIDLVIPVQEEGEQVFVGSEILFRESFQHLHQLHSRKIPLQQAAKPAVFSSEYHWKRIATRFVWAFALMIVGHVLISLLPLPGWPELFALTRPLWRWENLFFILAGFLAQMVDGALGMGYGMISAISLMSVGVNPVAVSAAIHTSEVFASGISGYSHYRFGNVNKKLFKHLVIPGVFGAILGALMLVFLGELAETWLRPLVAFYALFLGIRILTRLVIKKTSSRKIKRLGWLAGVGGFLDSFGGGGWGPIVTSTLISKGRTPRYIIGSVSLTEFFITLASAVTFIVSVGTSHLQVVLGLLVGGVLAAPLAARLAGRLPARKMLLAVGILVVAWSLRILISALL